MSSELKMIQHRLKGVLQQTDQAIELVALLQAAKPSEGNQLLEELAQNLEKIIRDLREQKR